LSILLNNSGGDNAPWEEAINRYLPNKEIHLYPNIPNANAIEYAVVWHHPHGDLLNYPNLKAVLVLGAGMDHIDAESELPDCPIVRLVDPAVGDDMAQYSLYWAMHFQRGYEDYRKQSAAKQWERFEVPMSRDFRISVLGLGPIGSFIAESFTNNNFATQGWSRKPKHLDKVRCLSGNEGLEMMLANTDVLINCLPLNDGTRNFLDHEQLSQLPKGSFVINVSRGAVIDDAALISLLDESHIAGAALDTFVEEPLPAASTYWGRENVHITPHVAGGTYAKSAAKVIADNIKRVDNGQAPFPIYQREDNSKPI
jgi:glyoxylate/hydroxypyruvate reductase A